jgi:hypothetical protein
MVRAGQAMSEQIQRWHLYSPIMREESETGEWVTYADHVSAVAVARKQGEQDQIDLTRDWGLHQHEVGRLQGQRDEREAAGMQAWSRVEDLPFVGELGRIEKEQLRAAIKGDDDE